LRLAVFAILVLLPAAALGPGQAQAGSIYYYQDERGVFHFTNKPTSPKYRFYAFFREAAKGDKEDILRAVKKSSSRHGMDEKLIQAVIKVESNFESEAVSHKGAEGLMQIMPETQKELGMREAFDVEENIEAGIRYLKKQYQRFGSWDLALAAYNAGPESVNRYGGIPPYPETVDYVKKVLKEYGRLQRKSQ
jgi:soluble lytic murein transglycosylase-like protein